MFVTASVALAQTQRPQFRSSVTQIEVDVSVTDGDGKFVKDLRPEDFEILEDGQAQTLSGFSLIDLPIVASASAKEALAGANDLTSNAESAKGRLWVMLLDTPAVGGSGSLYTRQTQNAARRFVEEGMAGGDSMAVIHIHGTMRQSQPLTANKRLLLESIDRFSMGAASAAPETESEQVARITETFRVIEDLSQRLGAITNRRTAVLWLGGGIPFDLASTDPRLPFAYRDAIRAAQRNNVAIYSIDPGGLGTKRLDLQGALRVVAEDTGGEAIVNTNDFVKGFARIVRDNSTYYLLGYSPRTEHVDGRFHSITVRVKRSGVSVRARRGYLAPERADAERTAAAGPPSVVEALRSPIPRTDIDVQLTLAPLSSARAGSVVLGAHVSGAALLGDEKTADIAYRVIDTDGKVIIERSGRAPIAATARTTTPGFGFDFGDRFDVPLGKYEVRFGVRVRENSVGTVVAYVEVPDFRDRGLALSGLLVGPRADGQGGVSTSSLAERRFRAMQVLNVSGALYAGKNIQIDRVRLDASVRDEAGKTVLTRSFPATTLPTNELNDRQFGIDLPLSQLTLGKYSLNVKAYVEGNERVAAIRDVTFWIMD